MLLAPVDAPIDSAPAGVGCGLAGYPAGPYGTSAGAVIANLAFQGLVLAGAPWAETPASTRSMYHHFGHMSWQSSERDRV